MKKVVVTQEDWFVHWPVNREGPAILINAR